MSKEKTKKMTVSIAPNLQLFAKELSIKLLGKENISGLFTFLLNREKKRNNFNPSLTLENNENDYN